MLSSLKSLLSVSLALQDRLGHKIQQPDSVGFDESVDLVFLLPPFQSISPLLLDKLMYVI